MHVLIFSIIVLLTSTIIIPTFSKSPVMTTMLNAPKITKPGCPRKCGNLTVPYPFGVGLGAGCSMSVWYDIFCMTSFNPPKAFLPTVTGTLNKNTMEIVDISETHIRLKNQVSYICFNSTDETSPNLSDYIKFNLNTPLAPYSVSGTANKLFVVGCQDFPSFSGSIDTSYFSISENGGASCRTTCSFDATDVVPGECNGIGCCQATIQKGMATYSVNLPFSNHTTTVSYNPCGYSFVADQESFKFRGIPDLDDPYFINRTIDHFPLVLDWVIAKNSTCANARRDLDSYACKENTICVNATDSGIGGYRCICSPGYEGQPYLTPGCSDINECDDVDSSPCSLICTNTPGNYTCSCPSGYAGDGRKRGTGCKRQFPVMKVALGVGFGSLSLLIAVIWLFLDRKKRRSIKMKEKFFQQNGGLLLKELITPNKHDNMDQLKVFTIEQLKVATQNFKDERIVGQGGYGTVYKGFLKNNQIVAIKRSKFLDESQIQQFINELTILARIRHPNVVQLLGCCLEVEVPLLVYEFISNGTLYDHIHSREGSSWYSWNNCLRIAMESANALAYVHSIPIIHRDIKSSNILLDISYTTKISDFGASRLIPLHNTHLSTVVQGTLGYLDPEYFFSSQLTEKSDVYSFGVVLAELLTRIKPILPPDRQSEENRNLAPYFVQSMQQDFLFDILDSQLIVEATQEQLISIANLVQRCLSVKGDDRPTMKEVAMDLVELWQQTAHFSRIGSHEDVIRVF